MGSSHHLASQAECTSAASVTDVTMGLAHAPRQTRMLAGQVSKILYIPALILAKGMYY